MTSNAFACTLVAFCRVAACLAAQPRSRDPEPTAGVPPAVQDGVVVPGITNRVQLRLYTNASPDAPHLCNTFDLEVDGAMLLQSPGRQALRRLQREAPSDPSLHHIVVDGRGPELASTNGLIVIEQAAGPDWRYVALDASAAYRDRLEHFRRAILFVEPDLFVLHDHLVAKQPVSFQMLLHLPAATLLDTNWGDLRLDMPRGGFHIHAPARKAVLRSWKRVDSAADAILPGTVTMGLGPTNKVTQLDVLTVLAAYPRGDKKAYAFKLLESHSAIGARIHRAGLPTLVAFKTDPAATNASLTGFGFSGPVGVSVFKPKPSMR